VGMFLLVSFTILQFTHNTESGLTQIGTWNSSVNHHDLTQVIGP
jgi:hypothetical protein